MALYNKHFRTFPFMRVFLLLNIGALIFGFLRVFVLPATSNFQNGAELAMIRSTSRRLQETQSQTHVQPCHCKDKSGINNTTSTTHNNADLIVPNIVHYIWYNTQKLPLQFHHLLSILSAHKVLKPDVIYLHTDNEPIGEYWEQAKKIPNFKVNYRTPPSKLYGEDVKMPKYYTSHSNVDRVKVLMEYGGIYMDFDTMIIRPLDDLRRYVCTIGLERESQACGSIIICSKNSVFLTLWINSYLDDYRMDEWAYNSGKVPANLARRYPHLVHVEETKLNRPNFAELDKIWGPTVFNWQENYALHTWYRIWKDMSPYYNGQEPSPATIKSMNNSFGQIARTIYYGSPDLIATDGF